MPIRLGQPDLGLGLGLRAVYQDDMLAEDAVRPDFCEIITDNIVDGGRPFAFAQRAASLMPVVLHGVGLSIGSPDPLDAAYIASVLRCRDALRARWVSDHLCFTGATGRNTHDLLPVPYTPAMLDHIADRVHQVQDALGAPLLIENASTYISYRESTLDEADFLAQLVRRTGCGLLLDVNNVYVNARNHGFDPRDWLAQVPWEHVVQFHVAGHTDHGHWCNDTHIGPVIEPVWELLALAWERAGGASVLLEWDAEIPPYAEVLADLHRAKRWLGQP